MDAVSIRSDWVGRKIDGRFPLIAWLGGSGLSGVFVTEVDGSTDPADSAASTPRKAVIKLIPALSQSEAQLATWSAAALLSHPHLVRILASGRAETEGADVIYVVTELAEEVLAQIIPERPLTLDETREMISPVVDALSYLHGEGYIHGHVSPSNILVVENEIKLSSEGLMRAGDAYLEGSPGDPHHGPETAAGPVTAASDVWSLGVTVVEALRQRVPAMAAEIPSSLPKPFGEIARECLQTEPARRCSLKDIQSMLEGKPRLTVVPRVVTPQAESIELVEEKRRTKIPVIPVILGLVLLVAIIVGLQMRSHTTNVAPVQTEATQQAPPAEPESHAPAPQAAGTTRAEVVGRVVPDVPAKASGTIQGKVTVVVGLTADASGSVSNAELKTRGPSAYFARIALESARKWKFKPAQENGRPVESAWTLRYEFRRSGTAVTPTQTAP
jgi:TonB family protein